MPLLADSARFDGFDGVSLTLLMAALVALALWLFAFGYRWLRTRPVLPAAGPAINEIPQDPESPALVNFLVHNWRVTQGGISATLLDLAARRVLGLDLVGGDQTVIRLRDTPPAGSLTPYELQAYQLVASRATGGSAPVAAIKLDSEGEAKNWTKRFEKAVIAEARAKGLARKRWEQVDYTIVGVGLAAAFGLFALAFGTADLGRDPGAEDDWTFWDWIMTAGFGWVGAMVLITRSQAVTDTPGGRQACTRWLGMRDYFRESHAFDDEPPAAVTVWDRLIAYGVATGTAREAAEGLPVTEADSSTAWSRSTGAWREIRIEYPTRFSFGEKPLKVFGEGLARTAFFGAIAWFILPIVVEVGWDLARDGLPGSASNPLGLNLLIAFVGGVLTIMGAFLSGRTIGGLIRLIRGGLDLTRRVTIEGEVVKVYGGRFAVDEGRTESVVALFQLPAGPQVSRGQRVRIVKSPYTHYLWSVTVLEDTSPGSLTGTVETAPAPTDASDGTDATPAAIDRS